VTNAPGGGASATRRLEARRALGVEADAVVYVCAQTLLKFNPAFDAPLKRILAAHPKSRLLVTWTPNQAVARATLERRWRDSLGPALEARVVWRRSMDHGAFLSALEACDVALDPYPFGGGVTSLELFAVGLPVVTAPPEQTVVGLAGGMYRAMAAGMGDVSAAECCVADGLEGYVARAVRPARQRRRPRARAMGVRSTTPGVAGASCG